MLIYLMVAFVAATIGFLVAGMLAAGKVREAHLRCARTLEAAERVVEIAAFMHQSQPNERLVEELNGLLAILDEISEDWSDAGHARPVPPPARTT